MKLLTTREVAKTLRVDDCTVRRWHKDGAIEGVYLPSMGKHKTARYKQDTIDKILQRDSSMV